jgi:hypothetical protein
MNDKDEIFFQKYGLRIHLKRNIEYLSIRLKNTEPFKINKPDLC